MVDNKTVGVSSLITMGIVVASMLIPGFFDEPKYYCESRPELGLQECDSFSKYVDPNGKCIKNDAPNLICRTGWLIVSNDMSDIDEPIEEDKPVEDKSTGKKYKCTVHNLCEEIK